MSQVQDSYIWMQWLENKRSKQKQEKIQQQQIQQQQQQQDTGPSTTTRVIHRIRNPNRKKRLGEIF